MLRICNECLKFSCVPGCPNYVQPKAKYYCDICGGGIYDGDEYIKNNNGDRAHWECIYTARDLAKWLDVDIRIWSDELF